MMIVAIERDSVSRTHVRRCFQPRIHWLEFWNFVQINLIKRPRRGLRSSIQLRKFTHTFAFDLYFHCFRSISFLLLVFGQSFGRILACSFFRVLRPFQFFQPLFIIVLLEQDIKIFRPNYDKTCEIWTIIEINDFKLLRQCSKAKNT